MPLRGNLALRSLEGIEIRHAVKIETLIDGVAAHKYPRDGTTDPRWPGMKNSGCFSPDDVSLPWRRFTSAGEEAAEHTEEPPDGPANGLSESTPIVLPTVEEIEERLLVRGPSVLLVCEPDSGADSGSRYSSPGTKENPGSDGATRGARWEVVLPPTDLLKSDPITDSLPTVLPARALPCPSTDTV